MKTKNKILNNESDEPFERLKNAHSSNFGIGRTPFKGEIRIRVPCG
jgi:hypothetical protein